MKLRYVDLKWIDEDGNEVNEKIRRIIDIEARKYMVYQLNSKKEIICEFDEEKNKVDYFSIDGVVVEKEYYLVSVYGTSFDGKYMVVEQLRLGGQTVLWCGRMLEDGFIVWHYETENAEYLIDDLIVELTEMYRDNRTGFTLGLHAVIGLIKRLVNRGDL